MTHDVASDSKRARFAEKHKRDGERLARGLRYLVEVFPGFSGEIEQFIQRVVEQSQRTRSSDQQRVIGALSEWREGLTEQEIVEETGLSPWEVRQILSDLMSKGIIRRRRQSLPGLHPTRSRYVYSLNG